MNRGFKKIYSEDPFLDSDVPPNNTKELIILICKLNKTGLLLLEYIARNGYVYKGKLLITPKEFMETTELRSKKSFYNGLDDLIEWGVIAKSEDLGFYYFNKKIFSWL